MSNLNVQPHLVDTISVWQGFKHLLPLSLFVFVFGLAFGLAAQQSGLANSVTIIMSTFVFAGAAQFAVLELWHPQLSVLPMIVTVFAINARHLLMGASLFSYLQNLPTNIRYAAMLTVSDANWALAMQAYRRGESGFGLLLGGGLAIWSFWVLGTWAGVYFGNVIKDPVSLGLDMVMSCFLLTMLVNGEKNYRIAAIWTTAGVTSLCAFYFLPANSHVIAGTLSGGILGGIWPEEKKCI